MTITTKHSFEDVLAAARRLDLNRTNHTFGEGARYRFADEEGCPTCLAGAIVAELDPNIFALLVPARSSWPTLPFDIRDLFSAKADFFLQKCQWFADDMMTWSTAIVFAEQQTNGRKWTNN